MLTQILLIALVVIMVILSAFFSSAEIVFASASRPRLNIAAESGDKRAIRACAINDRYTESISAILLGNNLVNIAASSAATVLFTWYYGSRGQTLSSAVMTAVILIFGEILPKILCGENADSIVLYFAGPLRFTMRVFHPVVSVVTKLVNFLSGVWTPEEPEPSVTDEELVEMVETIEDEGVITAQESELIRSAIEFSDATVKEILTPRVDVMGIDVTASVEDILSNDDLLSFSRVPVYDGTIDNVVGILNTKRMYKEIIGSGTTDIPSLMQEPYFIHMTMQLSDLLSEFLKRHVHIAVVADEFGGIMGIVTLEDVLEEIVGEIWDETDDIENEYTEPREGTFLVDGAMLIEDLFELTEYTDKDFESEYTTVGGWATEMLDKLPEPGDSFVYECMKVTVIRVDGNRAEQLRVEVIQPASKE